MAFCLQNFVKVEEVEGQCDFYLYDFVQIIKDVDKNMNFSVCQLRGDLPEMPAHLKSFRLLTFIRHFKFEILFNI